MAANDERVLNENRCIQTMEAVPTADGVLRHWLVYKFPVDAESGERYIGGVAVDISDRKHAEEELRRVLDELERRVAERTSLLTTANKRLEREALEREAAESALRDEQILLRRLLYRQEVIASHRLRVARRPRAICHGGVYAPGGRRAAIGDGPDQAREAFDTGLGLLRDTINEARRMINGLQPMLLEESGLAPAITSLIHEYFDPQVIQFEHQLRSERLTPLVEGILFRVCQEALTNATKYSQAKQIRVRLSQENAWVRLEIVDQGIGFDMEQAASANSFGLPGFAERSPIGRPFADR